MLAVDFALPTLLWTRRTRRLGSGPGIGLHLGLNYALRRGFFGWIMVTAYLAFLTPSEAGKLLLGTRETAALLGHRLRRRGGDEPGSRLRAARRAGKPKCARQDSNL